MHVWMFLRDLPWTIFAWTTGLKAREATEAYQAAKGRAEIGFGTSSDAQRRAIAGLDPELAHLKRTAIRRWIATAAIQIGLFAAIVGLAVLQE